MNSPTILNQDFPMHTLPNTVIEEIISSDELHSRHRQLNNSTLNHTSEGEGFRRLQESQEYGIALTQAPSVWALTKSRPNKYPNTPVKVCIVDTGYDGGHIDLPRSSRVTGTNTGYGNALTDGDGHGKFVLFSLVYWY